jgi:molecular chaperone DnaK (HSP70)
MSPLIRRSTPLPVDGVTRRLVTMYNDQEAMKLDIFEGEYKLTKNNHLLGGCVVSGIPKGVAGSQRVTLTLSVTEDAILTVSATTAWKSDGPIEVPIKTNPWLYTKQELLELVTIDPEARKQDETEADHSLRSFARNAAIRNLESYIRNAERDGTEFARTTTSEARQTVLEAARRLPGTPSWAELDSLRTLFESKFRDFLNGHPQEFSMISWGR